MAEVKEKWKTWATVVEAFILKARDAVNLDDTEEHIKTMQADAKAGLKEKKMQFWSKMSYKLMRRFERGEEQMKNAWRQSRRLWLRPLPEDLKGKAETLSANCEGLMENLRLAQNGFKTIREKLMENLRLVKMGLRAPREKWTENAEFIRRGNSISMLFENYKKAFTSCLNQAKELVESFEEALSKVEA